MRLGRRARWTVLILVAVGLILGLGSAAGARPETPERPAAPADHACRWERVQIGTSPTWTAELRCEAGAGHTSDPEDVPGDHVPPLPSACAGTYKDDRSLLGHVTIHLRIRCEAPPPPAEEPPADESTERRCRYERVRVEGSDEWTAELQCDDGVDPDEVPAGRLPPLPSGCTRTIPGIESAPGQQIVQIDCAPPGRRMIDCEDEVDIIWDDGETLDVPEDAPQWWLDQIEQESNVNEGEGCGLAEHPPQQTCADRGPQEDTSGSLVPDGCWGTYPASLYNLTFDDGDWLDSAGYQTRLMGWVTQVMFAIGKGAIQLTLWLVGWGFSFKLTEFAKFSENVGGTYQSDLIDAYELQNVVWFVLVGYMGFIALKGKVTAAGGELAVAIVMAGLSTVMFANRADYLESISLRMDEASADLLFAARGEDMPTEVEPDKLMREAIRPLQTVIFQEFVESPYLYLNYETRPTSQRCIDIANNILSTGWEGDGWPSRYMGSVPECEKAAEFNADVGTERMLGGLLIMIVALVVAAFLGLAAVTVVISKFLIAVLFAVMPFAILGAILPGTGRRIAWAWLGALVQLLVTAIGMSFLVALMMLAIEEVLGLTADRDLIERWAIVLLVVGTVYFTRKSLLSGGRALGTNLANALTRMSPASAGYQGRGSIGFDMNRTDRIAYGSMRGGIIGGGVAAAAVGGHVMGRLAERRVARRSYRGANKLERSRERGHHEYRHDTYRYGGRGPTTGTGGATGGLPPRGGNGPSGPNAGRQHSPTAAPAAGSPQDGEWRARYQFRVQMRRPRSLILHPIGGVADRVRQNLPLLGTKAQAGRETRAAQGLGRWTGRRSGKPWALPSWKRKLWRGYP